MGKRSDLDRRLGTLTDISAILRVMRTLAIMETGKLARFLPAQHRVVASIEAAAGEFLYFHPEVITPVESVLAVLLVIGSERGFCGDFNESILTARAACAASPAAPEPLLLAVGSRLCDKIPADSQQVAIAGACTAEEVPSVISRVIDQLNTLCREQGGALRLTVLCHGADEVPRTRKLNPFAPDLRPAKRDAHPPILHLSPAAFYSGLAEHYLYAALHEMFYQSLMAENRQRQRHIENAARRLNQKISDLNLRKNVLRQEEIINEIEALMLNTEPEFHRETGPHGH